MPLILVKIFSVIKNLRFDVLLILMLFGVSSYAWNLHNKSKDNKALIGSLEAVIGQQQADMEQAKRLAEITREVAEENLELKKQLVSTHSARQTRRRIQESKIKESASPDVLDNELSKIRLESLWENYCIRVPESAYCL